MSELNLTNTKVVDSLLQEIRELKDLIINKEKREPKTVMNVKEAADFLGLTPSTIYLYVRNDAIPYVKVERNGRLYFSRDKLEKWQDLRRKEMYSEGEKRGAVK